MRQAIPTFKNYWYFKLSIQPDEFAHLLDFSELSPEAIRPRGQFRKVQSNLVPTGFLVGAGKRLSHHSPFEVIDL